MWGSLGFALACALAVPHVSHPQLSDWYNAPIPVQSLPETAVDCLVVMGAGWLSSPLWSLQLEVLFSLLLPLYVIGATWLRGLCMVKLLVLLVIVGEAEILDVYRGPYLPMFALGVVLAFEQERIARLARRLTGFRAYRGPHRLPFAPCFSPVTRRCAAAP